ISRYVRVKVLHRLPVPAGAGGEDRVEGRGSLLVVLKREQTQSAELMQRGVRGKLRNRLIDEGQGRLAITPLERLTGLVEDVDRHGGGRERLRVVDRVVRRRRQRPGVAEDPDGRIVEGIREDKGGCAGRQHPACSGAADEPARGPPPAPVTPVPVVKMVVEPWPAAG